MAQGGSYSSARSAAHSKQGPAGQGVGVSEREGQNQNSQDNANLPN